MPVLEQEEAGDIFVLDAVVLGTEPGNGGAQVENWTVLDGGLGLVAGKRGPTRLGFTLLLDRRADPAVRLEDLTAPA
ncbi:hypothetical protein ACFVH6_32605 [Spirillospora sp. NPDC127200]